MMIGVAQVIGMNPIERSVFSSGPVPALAIAFASASGKSCPTIESASGIGRTLRLSERSE